jgi:Flp pilus assembly protein TadB
MCSGDRLTKEETARVETKYVGSLEKSYSVVYESAITEKANLQETLLETLKRHVDDDMQAHEEAKKERKADRKESRKWRWITLILGAVIAFLISIFTPIVISTFFH